MICFYFIEVFLQVFSLSSSVTKNTLITDTTTHGKYLLTYVNALPIIIYAQLCNVYITCFYWSCRWANYEFDLAITLMSGVCCITGERKFMCLPPESNFLKIKSVLSNHNL